MILKIRIDKHNKKVTNTGTNSAPSGFSYYRIYIFQILADLQIINPDVTTPSGSVFALELL